MALDEEALERMLARGGGRSDGPAPEMVTTDKTDEFEVYERKDAPEAPAVAPAAPAQEEQFEVYERTPEPTPPALGPSPEPAPAPAVRPVAAPALEPAAEAPAQDIEVRQDRHAERPSVWPPIRSHNPEPSEPAPEPTPEPAEVPSTRTGGLRIAIVQGTFNAEITDRMTELARQKAQELGAEVLVQRVHGVYDMPLVAQQILRRGDVDALVAIGVVVQGETKHDEVITHATAKSLQEVSLATGKPVGLGITGPGMTWKQAEARIPNAAHAVEAVVAVLELLA